MTVPAPRRPQPPVTDVLATFAAHAELLVLDSRTAPAPVARDADAVAQLLRRLAGQTAAA